MILASTQTFHENHIPLPSRECENQHNNTFFQLIYLENRQIIFKFRWPSCSEFNCAESINIFELALPVPLRRHSDPQLGSLSTSSIHTQTWTGSTCLRGGTQLPRHYASGQLPSNTSDCNLLQASFPSRLEDRPAIVACA